MEIKDYLEKTSTTQAEFARRLGVTAPLIYQWISGRRPISAEMAIRIEQASEGAVRCEELLPDVDWAYLRNSVPSHSPDAN